MIDSKEFRNTLGRFGSGITIVTTVDEGEVHGMTANAFVSVSLDPPLVLVSIDHKTRMHQVLPRTQKYGISILKHDQPEVSQHFAGRPLEKSPEFFWQDEIPLIKDSVAYLVCDVVDQHIVGDHTLYIGNVKWISYEEEEPLIFYGGKYRSLNNLEVLI
jgi:flavin reductase (DIM6/NTAB) family NADH-FMN oxidoreductase RutF